MAGEEKVTYGNKEITLWWTRGQVTSKTVWDEADTNITTSPNGYYVHGHTTHTYRHEIWLKDADGKVFYRDATDLGLPYDTGHVLDFLSASTGKREYTVQICNRTTQKRPEKNLNVHKILHRHGWGTARVLFVLLFFALLIPYMADDRAMKQGEAERVQFNQKLEARLQPQIDRVLQQYQADMSAAGPNKNLQARANSIRFSQLQKINMERGVSYRATGHITPPPSFFTSVGYGESVFILFLAVFGHALFRCIRPKYTGQLNRKIKEMVDQR